MAAPSAPEPQCTEPTQEDLLSKMHLMLSFERAWRQPTSALSTAEQSLNHFNLGRPDPKSTGGDSKAAYLQEGCGTPKVNDLCQ